MNPSPGWLTLMSHSKAHQLILLKSSLNSTQSVHRRQLQPPAVDILASSLADHYPPRKPRTGLSICGIKTLVWRDCLRCPPRLKKSLWAGFLMFLDYLPIAEGRLLPGHAWRI